MRRSFMSEGRQGLALGSEGRGARGTGAQGQSLQMPTAPVPPLYPSPQLRMKLSGSTPNASATREM